MKSLNNTDNLLVFDLTKLGAAYQIVNMFTDSEAIHVFEISPIGTQAVLILMSKDLILLQLIQNQCQSLYAADILSSSLVEKVQSHVLDPYLSQQKPHIESNLLFVETTFFSTAFKTAQNLVDKGLFILDFRAVRTSPPNLILTATSESVEKLNQFMLDYPQEKMTLIPKVQKKLKSFFVFEN